MESETSISTIIDGETDFVRDGDVILILTTNHSYRFAVSDSHERLGKLTGGSLGNQGLTAVSGSLIEQGSGAKFDVSLANSVCRIVTSDVTDLACVRESQTDARQVIKFPSLTD